MPNLTGEKKEVVVTRERKLELIIACVATSSLNKEDKMELVEFIERLRRIERMWRMR